MRGYIDLVEGNTENGDRALLDYLSVRPLDHMPYELWQAFLNYLSDDNKAKLAAHFEVQSVDELPPDVYYDLPDRTKRFIADWMEEDGHVRYYLHDDPHNAPAWMHLDVVGQVPAGTWMVHFTDAPLEIARDGFTRGVQDIEHVGLTRLNSMTGVERRTGNGPGYNFAYPLDTNLDARVGGYGQHAVLLQCSGVRVYHNGDGEEQIIFWGPSATNITPLLHQNGRWLAGKRGAKSLNRLVRSLNG